MSISFHDLQLIFIELGAKYPVNIASAHNVHKSINLSRESRENTAGFQYFTCSFSHSFSISFSLAALILFCLNTKLSYAKTMMWILLEKVNKYFLLMKLVSLSRVHLQSRQTRMDAASPPCTNCSPGNKQSEGESPVRHFQHYYYFFIVCLERRKVHPRLVRDIRYPLPDTLGNTCECVPLSLLLTP